MELDGEVAVVTGAAGGIGRALAARFVAEGAAVVLTDADEASLDDVAAGVRADGGEVLAVAADIGDTDAVMAVADAAFERFGRIGVVCANVGIMGPEIVPVWEVPMHDWHQVLQVNTMGAIHTISAFVPRMVEAGHEGHVVVTSSMAGVTAGSITTAPYLASKHATRSVAETLHRDLIAAESPIGVSVLCPGPVNTGMLAHVRDTFPEFDSAHAAVGGQVVLEPAEIAAQVIDAIRVGRFYIFTHSDARGRITDWFDAMLADLRD